MKTCSKCKAAKAAAEFSRAKKNRDGLQGWCKPCVRADLVEWRKANVERDRANQAAWRRANPDKLKVSGRRSKLKAKFGITLEQYDAMLADQGGRCGNPGCRTDVPRGNGRFHVDHDHATGKVRGLLCNQCNVGIGNLRDSVAVLLGAVEYLKGVPRATHT